MSEYQSVSDDAILQQVPIMCDLLGLKKTSPRKISWRDTIPMGRGGSIPVPVDYPFISRGQMTLSNRLNGVLSAEQWKTLIGSSLLVNSWAKPRAIRTLIVGLIVALLYYIPALFLTLETNLLGSTTGSILTFPAFPVVIFLVVTILYARIYSPEAHQEALRADLQVAGLVGRDVFLETLQKIDSLGLSQVQKLEQRPSRYKRPSVQERIQNIQTGGTMPLSLK